LLLPSLILCVYIESCVYSRSAWPREGRGEPPRNCGGSQTRGGDQQRHTDGSTFCNTRIGSSPSIWLEILNMQMKRLPHKEREKEFRERGGALSNVSTSNTFLLPYWISIKAAVRRRTSECSALKGTHFNNNYYR